MIRSIEHMKTFEIVATDGRIGAVDDFYFDDLSWAIRAEHIDRQWEADYYQHLQQSGYWLTEEDARVIKEVQSYLREDTDRHDASVERRSRPR